MIKKSWDVRAIIALLTLMITIASLWYLWPKPVEFPMDDTYIHFVYAQNLVEQGFLAFNYPSEQGIGSTSLTWVALLAGGHYLGVSMHLLAKLLGLASLITVGMELYLLLRPLWGPFPALFCAMLVVFSGNMLWFALSGMETMLFLALGLLALLLYREEHWVLLGLVMGLLVLTRVDGLALAASIGGVELVRHKGFRRGIIVTGLICLLVCGPWFGYLYWRTGSVLPTSAIGKHLSSTTGIRLVLSRNEYLAFLARFPFLVYPVLWVVYLLEFVLGGMSFPEPKIPVGALLGNTGYTLSVWAILAWLVVIAPLVAAFGRGISGLRKWSFWFQDRASRLSVVFITWVVLHNMSYMIFLPAPGTASRYGSVNHVLLWVVLADGLFQFTRSRLLRYWLATGLGVVAISGLFYWNDVYDANLDYMQNSRIPAASYVREHFPADAQCAAFDVGALRYYSQRPLIDLGGLLDPSLGERFLRGELDRYLLENQVSCLILPGRSITNSEGWFDFATTMGLSTSSLIDMHKISIFTIDRDRWLQGYLPTLNYQEAIVMYLVERENPRRDSKQ